MSDVSLNFSVEGSTGNIYTVKFEKENDYVSASCNCEAGKRNVFCKHIKQLFDKNLDNKDLISMVHGTQFEQAINDVILADSEMEQAKKKLSLAKKRLSRVMHP